MARTRKKRLGIYEAISNVGLYGKDSDDIRLDTMAFIREQQRNHSLIESGGDHDNVALASRYLEAVTRRYNESPQPPLWMQRLLDQINSNSEHFKAALQHVISRQRARQKATKNQRRMYGYVDEDDGESSDLSSRKLQPP